MTRCAKGHRRQPARSEFHQLIFTVPTITAGDSKFRTPAEAHTEIKRKDSISPEARGTKDIDIDIEKGSFGKLQQAAAVLTRVTVAGYSFKDKPRREDVQPAGLTIAIRRQGAVETSNSQCGSRENREASAPRKR